MQKQAIKFQLVEVTNPATGDVVKKFRVLFNDLTTLSFVTDLSLEDIRAQKEELLPKVSIGEGQFGKYAYISRAKVLEEI